MNPYRIEVSKTVLDIREREADVKGETVFPKEVDENCYGDVAGIYFEADDMFIIRFCDPVFEKRM